MQPLPTTISTVHDSSLSSTTAAFPAVHGSLHHYRRFQLSCGSPDRRRPASPVA
ncbi:hypothetical protein OIU76_003372, partial [Salix suchowensis]